MGYISIKRSREMNKEKDIQAIFFDLDNNWFVDEDGEVIVKWWEWIRPLDLELFRAKRDFMMVPAVFDPVGTMIEIFWPDDEYRLLYEAHVAMEEAMPTWDEEKRWLKQRV